MVVQWPLPTMLQPPALNGVFWSLGIGTGIGDWGLATLGIQGIACDKCRSTVFTVIM